ncbi:MAG: outer membrane protein assembly factor BamE [candidate division NC10 bacterium]|nr:outer membrane protein assembly factor BamE [candidate division NC10 bacterium]
MSPSGTRWRSGLGGIGLALLALVPGLGCGPAALLIMTAAGGAAAVSGEPQRLANTQGQDFDEQRVSRLRSGTHTREDVVNLLGQPQTKVFMERGEEWAYRYHVPPSLLRTGTEKVLTIRFRNGTVQEVRYSISAL